MKEEIDAQDFREIKRENERKIERLEARLIEVSSLSANIEPLLEKAVSNLAHLDELYQDGDTKRKRTIIGSIYPEKLTFDGFQYRTTRVNEAVELIYTLDAGFSQKETGQTKEDFDLSCLVTRAGLAPLIPAPCEGLTQRPQHLSALRLFHLSAHTSKLAPLPNEKTPQQS
ncbi:hypothetical protein [Puia dinghuensis]|uniref:hypothetical protein n=1 Tax=Puia dinghuensis TaxID=1792502 RepID=UPI0016635420|nr:hypothetical protein [Puia dinghuensis]